MSVSIANQDSAGGRNAARVFCLAAGLAIISCGAASAATRIGWVVADQPSAESYAPSADLSFNSTGGAISVTRQAAGSYSVSFEALGSNLSDNVQVTAYNTSGTCMSNGWEHTEVGQVLAHVNCYDASGQAGDAAFSLLYQAQSARAEDGSRGLAFLWADDASAASYVPPVEHQFNSTGGSNSVDRNNIGSYTVTIPGMDKIGGFVGVTAVGTSAGRCKTNGWSSDSSGTHVGVICFNGAGGASDSQFSLIYARKTTLTLQSKGSANGFYALADKTKSSSYQTGGAYSYNGFQTGRIVAGRTTKGVYQVELHDIGEYSTSNVQVGATGGTSSYCNVMSWYPVMVDCFRQGGEPVNSVYDVAFSAH